MIYLHGMSLHMLAICPRACAKYLSRVIIKEEEQSHTVCAACRAEISVNFSPVWLMFTCHLCSLQSREEDQKCERGLHGTSSVKVCSRTLSPADGFICTFPTAWGFLGKHCQKKDWGVIPTFVSVPQINPPCWGLLPTYKKIRQTCGWIFCTVT
jgi:hypothetical protein